MASHPLGGGVAQLRLEFEVALVPDKPRRGRGPHLNMPSANNESPALPDTRLHLDIEFAHCPGRCGPDLCGVNLPRSVANAKSTSKLDVAPPCGTTGELSGSPH